MGRVLGASAALLCLSFAVSAAIAPAAAEKVGVAAAVNPDAFSSLSGAPRSQLNIGKSIFYNERINTTTSGLVQVLLVDGSTFTVGPGSDLVIDKFVYDPQTKTGQIAASFSKGVMRFVGGKISKHEGGVTIDTPAGALAIRGGMVQGNGKIWSFLYGVQMTLKGNNGKTYTVYEPGYTLDLSTGTPTIRPTTAADTGTLMSSLTNSNSAGVGNSSDQQSGNQLQTVDTLSLQDMISDAAAEQATDTATETNPTTEPNEAPEPQPTEVTVRVLNAPGVYTAFPGTSDEFTTEDGNDAGILGGDPVATVDDFEWTFSIENGRLVGTVSGLLDSFQDCPDGPGSCQIHTEVISDAQVDFPTEFPVDQCAFGVCAVTDATVTQDDETTTYVGLAVLKKDFFAYHLVNAPETGPLTHALDYDYHPEPILAFGGTGHDFGTPSGRTFAFLLTPDVKEALNGSGAIGPFAGAGSSPQIPTDQDGNPIGPPPAISPLLYLEKDSASPDDQSRAVWLQTGLYINTTPAEGETEFDQQSWVNVALGAVNPETGGLFGARRGGAAVDFYNYEYGECGTECGGYTTREAFAFTGDIASLAGPDGSHFMGSDDPNIVIGIDSTGTHNIGRDIPLDPNPSEIQNQSGAVYHIGVGLGTLPPQDQTLDGTYQGYAAGMVQSSVPSQDFANVVASRSPDDFGITFDNTRNTLSADLSVYDIQHTDSATGRYSLSFGDNSDSTGRSAYIDNLHYAAIENGSNQVSNWNGQGFADYDNTVATSYLVGGDQLNVTQFFPDTFEADEATGYRPFCTDCGFLQWGAWGTRVAFGDGTENNPNATQYVDNVHLGWWVAGDIATQGDEFADLDKLSALNATATYSGHAIGNVANNIDGNGRKTYVAAGDLSMTWNFKPQAGSLTIDKFDKPNFGGNGLTFTGPMSAPGQLSAKHFQGSLTGQLPENLGSVSGSAAGSFVNDGGKKAAGVIGNWNVGGDAYKAGGIFAGSGTPAPGAPGP
jgi:hypothetical protein